MDEALLKRFREDWSPDRSILAPQEFEALDRWLTAALSSPCACGGEVPLAVVDDWLGDVVPGCAVYLAGHGLVYMGLPEDAPDDMKLVRVIVLPGGKP